MLRCDSRKPPKNTSAIKSSCSKQRELMCILSCVDGIEEQEWLDQQDVIIDQFHPVPTTTLETATPIISTSREPLWRIGNFNGKNLFAQICRNRSYSRENIFVS